MAEKEYIEREKIKFHRTGFEERCHNDVWTEYVDIAYKSEVDSIPAADVRPSVRGGKWKPIDLTYGRSYYYCTACEETVDMPTAMGIPMFQFCPNCGAGMKEES